MKTSHVLLLVLVVVVVGSAAGLVRADYVINPTSTFCGTDVYSPSGPTIDGSGLSDPSQVANGAPVPASWTTNNCTGVGAQFNDGYGGLYSKGGLIRYDFAAPVNISYGHLWQYAGDLGDTRSLRSAEIWVSHTTDTWDEYHLEGSVTGYAQPAGTQDPGMNFNFASTNVRFIQLRSLQPWINPPANDVVGFGEIRFVGNAVPEPGTIVLVTTGLIGLLCYAWRKQR
jgi:hypothetical protein